MGNVYDAVSTQEESDASYESTNFTKIEVSACPIDTSWCAAFLANGENMLYSDSDVEVLFDGATNKFRDIPL